MVKESAMSVINNTFLIMLGILYTVGEGKTKGGLRQSANPLFIVLCVVL